MACLPLSGGRGTHLSSQVPAHNFSLHLSDHTFQLFHGMPLVGRITFSPGKYTQHAKPNELSPALKASQSTPEKSIKLHATPNRGACRAYKAETPCSPVAGSLPSMGCPAFLLWLLLFHVVILQEAGKQLMP